MSLFSHEIDRLFEELVHDVWRRPRQPPELLSGTSLEFDVPRQGEGREDIAFTTDTEKVMVTVRRHAGGTASGSGTQVLRDAEHFQQTFTLPVGSEVAAMEARFERDALRVRVTLRKRPFSMEKP